MDPVLGREVEEPEQLVEIVSDLVRSLRPLGTELDVKALRGDAGVIEVPGQFLIDPMKDSFAAYLAGIDVEALFVTSE
jgi:hypothetical protein